MVTVKKCLWFKLETGAKIIGWIFIIGHSLAVVMGIFVILDAVDCETALNTFGADKEGVVYICSSDHKVGILGISVLLDCAAIVISCFCIIGTNERKHSYINPFKILMKFEYFFRVLLFVLKIYKHANVTTIMVEVILILIHGYWIVVIQSLHDLFKREFEEQDFEQRLNLARQQPIMDV